MAKGKCYDCKHSGEPFKLPGGTHMHCQHPKYEEQGKSEKISPWETLCFFADSCEDHEPAKEVVNDKLK